jgi:citryl-CoA synthetase large subunit
MNLYEFEGKQLFEKHGIAIPRGIVVRRGDAVQDVLGSLGVQEVVVKAQVLSGKRGKNNGIRFCSSDEEIKKAVEELFTTDIRGQYVAAVRIEEKLDIVEEHYFSITYDTNEKQPVLIYSKKGGMDIEDVPDEDILRVPLDIRQEKIESKVPFAQELWDCFLAEDARLAEINPLVKTMDGEWIAADAKIAIDDDAFYRHSAAAIERAKEKGKDAGAITNWEDFEPRTMMGRPPTEREIAVKKIDEGEDYYRGTAGKYIEMSGDIAILFSGGGASIANMDALIKQGLKPANYTEYSGNPPREKVHALARIVLSKPGLKGLWIAGGVANFTNIKETFQGIVDVLDELKPAYPIVVRRAGPFEKEGMELMQACAERNHLNMKLFSKEVSMSETAKMLASMVKESNI